MEKGRLAGILMGVHWGVPLREIGISHHASGLGLAGKVDLCVEEEKISRGSSRSRGIVCDRTGKRAAGD